jgi:hypothetical protein
MKNKKTYRIICLSMTVILLSSCLFSVYGADNNSRSKVESDIEMDKLIHDFGEIIQDEKVDVVFKILNVGTGFLVIEDVETSCGCTATKIVKEIIPPGEESELEVEFDSYSYTGDISKDITLTTNDPDEERVNLVITGHVKEILSFNPRYIHFSNVLRGQTASKTLYIAPAIPLDEYHIINIKSTADYLSAKYKRLIEAGGYEIELNLSEETPVGHLTEYITIYTNIEIKPTYRIMVTGSIRSTVEVKPKYLFFNLVHKESEQKEIKILTLRDMNLEVKRIKSQFDFVTTKIISRSKKEVKALIKITAPEDKTGRLQDQLTIETNDPYEPVKKFIIQMSINPTIKVTPKQISLKMLAQPNRTYYPIMVKSYKDPIEIKKVETDLKYIDVSEIATMEPGKLFHIKVKYRPDTSIVEKSGKIMIHTSNRKYPPFEIPVIVKKNDPAVK